MVVVLAAAALFVYLRLRSDLDESVDAGLRARADDVAALVARSVPRLPAPAEPDERFTQVLTESGRLLAASGSRRPALSPAEARQAADRELLLERDVPGIEGTARVLARPATAGARRFVVVTGASLEDRDETLSGLVTSFLIGMPVAVLLASGLGYLLAAAGLAPVDAMRRRAEQVSLAGGVERLPLPTAHDEVRRLGETLNEMLARLEASFERERRFVADASHELRTPLAVLKAELENSLAESGEDARTRESLTAALGEADHLAQLADDLLLIARAGEGKLTVRPEPVEVRGLLDQARDRFIERARGEGREISVRAPHELECPLDPLRLRQALGNLVDNALRHGEGEVALVARDRNGEVEIEVSDDGPGFTSAIAERAFERFARGDGERTRSGAGLGLAIVRAIAQAHGGTAEVAGGATVRLRFPLTSISSGRVTLAP